MITWHPIAELPDELKDGREVLLWDADEAQGFNAVVATFSSPGGWRNDEFMPIPNPTYFAEINAPQADRSGAEWTRGRMISCHDCDTEFDRSERECPKCGLRTCISGGYEKMGPETAVGNDCIECGQPTRHPHCPDCARARYGHQ